MAHGILAAFFSSLFGVKEAVQAIMYTSVKIEMCKCGFGFIHAP
jgi:hypothetical protein